MTNGVRIACVRSTRTVLIVDDYPSVLAWASRAFARDGWHVLAATSSGDALTAWRGAKMAGTRVQLLVTDLELPDLDGPSLARALRDEDPTLCVIGITGHAERGAGWHGTLLHRTAFFRKPMTAAELLAAANALANAAPADQSEMCPMDPIGLVAS
ncbi:response regulator [Gemmatimonas sp.]|uniref:response regulator n=1 Tax=Gemmatimonas sp. TaxID=1962908 RepID=UPI003983628C